MAEKPNWSRDIHHLWMWSGLGLIWRGFREWQSSTKPVKRANSAFMLFAGAALCSLWSALIYRSENFEYVVPLMKLAFLSWPVVLIAVMIRKR